MIPLSTAILLVGLSIIAFYTTAHPTPSESPFVYLSQGKVTGTQLSESVNGFLAIPYAQPPIGNLRFKPPQKLKLDGINDTITINGTSFGASCYQFNYRTVWEENLLPTTPESEDCLTLNVFVPKQKNDHDLLLPVYIWSYGGAFGEGGGSVPLYDPTGFAENVGDIIIVTWNYRMNLFGFPNSPALDLATGQNLGIRDQRAALEWLRENIEAFGGDPKHMIMGGQSSGADTAHSFVYSYQNDTIISGLALQSGLVQVINAAEQDADTEFVRVATAVGCNNADRVKELYCMKSINAKLLKTAISNKTFNYLGSPAGGTPMVDNSTLFTLTEYARRGAAGDFAKLPTLMGMTKNEADGVLNWGVKGGVNKTASDLITFALFDCPMALEAGFRAAHESPVWRYHYNGIFPITSPYPWLRPFHTGDIPMLLGSYRNIKPFKEPQNYEIEASKTYQNIFAKFIRDPVHGLSSFQEFNSNTSSLIELLTDHGTSIQIVDPKQYDSSCMTSSSVPYEAILEIPPE